MSVATAERFTTKTPESSLAVFRSMRGPFCCADEQSSHGLDTGPSRPASWRTAKPYSRAAARESLEEAQAQVQIGSLVAIVDVIEAHQVHMFFRAALPRAEFGISAESLEVALFAEADIPWADIAFPASRLPCADTFLTAQQGVRNCISPRRSAAPGSNGLHAPPQCMAE